MGVVIVTLIGVFFFWPANSSINTAAQTESDFDYPVAWTSIGIPNFPGAIVRGTQGSDVHEGIEFELEIDKPANEIGSFYEEQFRDRDFDADEPTQSDDKNYVNNFGGGDLDISVDVRPDPSSQGRSRVRIWVEKHRKSPVNVRNASIFVD